MTFVHGLKISLDSSSTSLGSPIDTRNAGDIARPGHFFHDIQVSSDGAVLCSEAPDYYHIASKSLHDERWNSIV